MSQKQQLNQLVQQQTNKVAELVKKKYNIIL